MKKCKNIIPNGINNTQHAKHLEYQSQHLPCDQVYRELIKNSLEAIAKVKEKNFKGKISIDSYSTELKNKFSIVDNGVGMSKDRIVDLVNNFSETEEQSPDGNFGHGTKVSAMCTNKEGVFYQSFRKGEDEGSAVLVKKDDKEGYGVQVHPEYNSGRRPLSLDQKPNLIKKTGHGTMVTLLGNHKNEDTTKVPEKYPVNSLLGRGRMGERWLLTFANTKFFTIPNNLDFNIRWSPNKPDSTGVKGHKHYLDKHSINKGTLNIQRAKIHWWIINNKHNSHKTTHHLTVGQLAFLHKGEILSVDYNCMGRKNPLRSWGLPFTDTRVAIIVEPINFGQDIARGTLKCLETGLGYEKFRSSWREQFVENMPEAIRKFEKEEADKKLVHGIDYDSLGKQIAKDLKDMYGVAGKGDLSGESSTVKTGSFLGHETKDNISDKKRDGKHPGLEGYGESLLDAIIIKSNSPKKASRTISAPNLWPNIQRVKESNNGEDISYIYDSNTLIFNLNGSIVGEYLISAKVAPPQREKAKTLLTEYMIKKLGIQIAYFRGRDLGIIEEDKEKILNNQTLIFSILDKSVMVDELKRQLINLYKKYPAKKLDIAEMTAGEANYD